jgi:hypothetical protein
MQITRNRNIKLPSQPPDVLTLFSSLSQGKNKIQNHITRFLKKALPVFSLLLGVLFFAPSVAGSAIRSGDGDFIIVPYSLTSGSSEALFMDIMTANRVTGITSVSRNKTVINLEEKIIRISLDIIDSTALQVFSPPLTRIRVQAVNQLPASGDYQVFVYRESSGGSTFFEEQYLLGSFNLSIDPMRHGAIKSDDFIMSPYPLKPMSSEALFMDLVTADRLTGITGVSFKKTAINLEDRIIEIHLEIIDTSSMLMFSTPLTRIRTQVLSQLPAPGDYQVFIYNAGFALGAFNLTIAPAVASTENSIPTLSEWMLILMAIILLFFAMSALRTRSEC